MDFVGLVLELFPEAGDGFPDGGQRLISVGHQQIGLQVRSAVGDGLDDLLIRTLRYLLSTFQPAILLGEQGDGRPALDVMTLAQLADGEVGLVEIFALQKMVVMYLSAHDLPFRAAVSAKPLVYPLAAGEAPIVGLLA